MVRVTCYAVRIVVQKCKYVYNGGLLMYGTWWSRRGLSCLVFFFSYRKNTSENQMENFRFMCNKCLLAVSLAAMDEDGSGKFFALE